MRRAAVAALWAASAAAVAGAGCNAVLGLDPPRHSDAAADDAPDDADIDATACVTDGFDGAMLDPHWTLLTGALPTQFSIGGSRILIADAPFATTPSMPALSWIYDLDTDKGNQLAWAQPIGDRDFTVDADIGWSSSLGELTLAGIAVADDSGTIHARIGVQDGSAATTGHLHAQMRVAGGPDLAAIGPPVEPGSAHVRIERVGGLATISADGAMLISRPMPSAITQVSMVYVQYRDATTSYPYGSFEVASLDVCTY